MRYLRALCLRTTTFVNLNSQVSERKSDLSKSAFRNLSNLKYCSRKPVTLFKIREKEDIWLSCMTKAHLPTEMSERHSKNTKNATTNSDYTAIADRLRTVPWINV